MFSTAQSIAGRSVSRQARCLSMPVARHLHAPAGVKTLGVVGAGQMGLGIAYVAAKVSDQLVEPDLRLH